MKNIQIAIDGGAASGKTTAAKGLSRRLGIPVLTSGIIYRAIAFWMIENKIDFDDEKGLALALIKIDLQIIITRDDMRVIIDGYDVTSKLNDNLISKSASIVSKLGTVRNYVNGRIGELVSQSSFIVEGRDIGTVVLPHADYKFFLTASDEVKAKRRQAELLARGETVSFNEIFEQVRGRDKADKEREIDPLKKAQDAIEIDTTKWTAEKVIERMAEYIEL
ncbi:MAG: (d)CMP kinase [Christensenellaceae bacterium]|jgi:cytidylate kinase|nr:(d)CMP kinase [Christensenellaceae bacterium]